MNLINELGAIFVTGLFGNTVIAAVFLFTFMAMLGLAMRFTFDCWIATMTPLAYTILFHPATRMLPYWLWVIWAMIMGALIAFGIFKMIRR